MAAQGFWEFLDSPSISKTLTKELIIIYSVALQQYEDIHF